MRINGNIDVCRNWAAYRKGFGSLVWETKQTIDQSEMSLGVTPKLNEKLEKRFCCNKQKDKADV